MGGLSVLRELRRELPAEDLTYVADAGFAPYGTKSEQFVRGRALAIVRFFVEQDVKAIVVACNTATAAAADMLRARFDLPIVGVEPGVKPAISASRSGVVGVLATSGTLESDRFGDLVRRVAGAREIVYSAASDLI